MPAKTTIYKLGDFDSIGDIYIQNFLWTKEKISLHNIFKQVYGDELKTLKYPFNNFLKLLK